MTRRRRQLALDRANNVVLSAYDICGVQPMTGPSGLVFAMRARYVSREMAERMTPESEWGDYDERYV
jgi:hypothetical protein